MNLKSKIRQSGVFQWEIAETLGVNEVTFCRWMRRPEKLSPARRREIEKTLERLAVEKNKQRRHDVLQT